MDPNLIVGRETGDDAAVYRIAPDQAVVFTVDYFMPIHDDAFTFGQIAAANSLSDIWAMGGRPMLALNVCGFPREGIALEMLADILKGGEAKAAEASVVIAGGHTLDNPQPFYGLAVLGFVHPDKVMTNSGAMPGDQLVLTKPLGTGIVMTAMMRDAADEEDVAAAADCMGALSKTASEVMMRFGASAATDITGFALIGHAHEMAEASGTHMAFQTGALPLLPGVMRYAQQQIGTGGGARNQKHYGRWVDFGEAPEERIAVLCDPQTSGGLLIAFPPNVVDAAVSEMRAQGVQAARVGEVSDGEAGRLSFR